MNLESMTRRDAFALAGGGIAAFLLSATGLDKFSPSEAYGITVPPGDVTIRTFAEWSYPPAAWTIDGGYIVDSGTRIEVSYNGATGLAYCVNPGITINQMNGTPIDLPALGALPSGYTVDDIATFLYFALGGPGYYADEWPKWIDGSKLNDRQIYWTGHYLATYLIWGNGKSNIWQSHTRGITSAINHGAHPSLLTWFNDNAIPFLANKILPRKNQVPDSFQAFAVNAYKLSNADTQVPATQMFIASIPPQVGTLTVVKLLNHGDVTRDFHFTVRFSGTGAPATQRFMLRPGGMPWKLEDIPFGVSYEVTEDEGELYSATWQNRTGTISSSNVDALCACTNDIGSITVKKTMSLGETSDKFQFRVTLTTDGVESSQEFELGANETKTIPDLKFGTQYVVEELGAGASAAEWSGNRTGTITRENPVVSLVCDNKFGYVKLRKQFTR